MRYLLLLLTVSALAQHQHPAATSEKPATLLPGLGSLHHSIATRNPEAQKFFNQGLTLLFGFNRYEALRSFQKAAELDPQAVMPRWGISMAHGPHINMDLDGDYNAKESCAAVDAAKPLLAKAPAHEPRTLKLRLCAVPLTIRQNTWRLCGHSAESIQMI